MSKQTQAYKLNIEVEDTSYFSLVRALEEILNKVKEDEDNIQFGKAITYEDTYELEPDFGRYKATICRD